jgi:hypothetical protein
MMATRPPLRGVTLPADYAIALRDWRREKKFRKERIGKAEDEGMLAEEIAASQELPPPRGWWEYAVDPAGDGAPVAPDGTEDWRVGPGGLDRANDLNTDSLVLTDWWDGGTAGMQTREILQYQSMLKSEIDGVGNWLGYYADEAWTPDIYIRTSMADYVPNPFNIFMDTDGDRLDPSNTENAWLRTGQTLAQGTIGYLVMGGMIYVGLQFAPKVVDKSMEVLESIVTGLVEIPLDVFGKIASQRLRMREAKEAITGD